MRLFAVTADGQRRAVRERRLVAELEPGVEIELDFSRRTPCGHLALLTPRMDKMGAWHDEGHFPSFAVVFAGANVLHVFVERGERKVKAPVGKPPEARTSRVPKRGKQRTK